MARFDSGWFRMERKVLTKFGKDHYLWAVWAYMNFAANPYESEMKVGPNFIKIMPGELVITIKELSDALNIHRDTVRRCLRALEACGAIVPRILWKKTKFSLIFTSDDRQHKPIQHKDLEPRPDLTTNTNTNTMTNTTTTHIQEPRIEKEERERSAREKHSPPPIKSQILESEPKIENSYASQIANKAPPIEGTNQAIVRQPIAEQKPLESILEPIEVWRLYTAELGKAKAIKTFSPTPSDLNFAQQIASELVTEEAITDAIKKYLAMDRPIYQERVWPLKFLSEDLTMVLATKGKSNPNEENLKTKTREEKFRGKYYSLFNQEMKKNVSEIKLVQ